jgi:CheY-like chemotaxis protein
MDKKSKITKLIEELHTYSKDKSVLIVDDEPITRKMMISSLEPHFKKVIEAENGQDGLKKYGKYADFDLIISDIIMPDMDGVEFSKHIKSFNKEQPIIIISSENDNKLFFELIEIGVDSFISKPFDLSKVIPKIVDIFSKKSYEKNIQKSKTGNLAMLEKRVQKLSILLEESMHELRHIKKEICSMDKNSSFCEIDTPLETSNETIEVVNIEVSQKIDKPAQEQKPKEEVKNNTTKKSCHIHLSAKEFMNKLRDESNWDAHKSNIKTIIHQTQQLEKSLKEITSFTINIGDNINLDVAEAILEDIAKLFLDISKSVEKFEDLEEVGKSIEEISKFFYINKELRGFTSSEVREFLEIDFLIDDVKDFIASVFVTEAAKDIMAFKNIFISTVDILQVSILNADKITHEED